MSLPLPKTTSRDEAIGLLAPALGEEKARSTVDAATSALGLASSEWTSAEFRAVFAHIATESGLVGITARVVSRRLRHAPDVHERSAVFPKPAHAPVASPRPVDASQKPLDALADLLAQALGADVATREVEKAARALGLGETVHFSDALRLFEHMSHEPGLVGIAAQFAKTRLHLITW